MSIGLSAAEQSRPRATDRWVGRKLMAPPNRPYSIPYRAYRLIEAGASKLLLHFLPPELAHWVAIRALMFGRYRPQIAIDESSLAVQAMGLSFPNLIGVAAGLDKDAQAVEGALSTGFGFTEVGTLTPEPQGGNDKPRVFRLRSNHAIINRFGFNNFGHDRALQRLRSLGDMHKPVGVNLGVNKTSINRIADYVQGIEKFASEASYFTINISSPNTPRLRDLQHETELDELLARIIEARERVASRAGRKPVLLKIAPDVTLSNLDAIISVALRRGLDGMVVSNTTTSRPNGVLGPLQDGGLSGRPLFALSTRILAETFLRAGNKFPLIGAGGIDSGRAAWEKVCAGATLLQLYTGLVYFGPSLIDDIKYDLSRFITDCGFSSIADAVGVDAKARCAEPWPA